VSCSLAFQSRTAACRRAFTRPFQRRANAQNRAIEGGQLCPHRGATARFQRQMHERLGAKRSEGEETGRAPPSTSSCRPPRTYDQGVSLHEENREVRPEQPSHVVWV
jgi:hypothetical protein